MVDDCHRVFSFDIDDGIRDKYSKFYYYFIYFRRVLRDEDVASATEASFEYETTVSS